ncbi:MAG TPA: hypothetical protein VG102_00770 [Candidatus Paceibacterota bacterium]|jgi:hypothetical protein|nr:hypothetical protein [Candidatus Paceibacterota bacterium]
MFERQRSAAMGGDIFGAFGTDSFDSVPDGEVLAKGDVAVVLAAARTYLDEHMPSSLREKAISELERSLDRAKSSGYTEFVIYETDEGLTIAAKQIKGSFDGKDLPDGLAAILAEALSGKRGNGTAGLSGLLDALRRAAEKAKANDPLQGFLGAHVEHLKANTPKEDKKKDRPMAITLSIASATLAVALARFETWQDSKPTDLTRAFIKMVDELRNRDAGRYAKLCVHFGAYNVHMEPLLDRLSSFARNPRVDYVSGLVADLMRITPAAMNIVRDADERAKRAAEEARAV